MEKKFIAFILILLSFTIDNQAQLTIHTIGDSTMEQKSEDPTANPNGQRGWAQMLSQFIVNGAVLNNRSKSGTSSKTFYEEKDSYGNYRFWPTVKPQIKAGDYVIIQFGHNDEKDGGWQSSQDGLIYSGIGTNPWELYTVYLTKYVNEVRELGAIPILLTPIVRNSWTGTSISSTGAHNIGTDSIGRALDYPAAMRKVATDMNVPLIDHTLLTKAACEQYGQAKVTELIYNVGDGTHLGEYGATLYARLAVQDLIRQGILTDYLNANPDLLISKKSYDFGKCYVNTSSICSISISGVDLVPATGNINITAPAGFSVSTQQNGVFSSSIQVDYTLGNLNATYIYVKYNPESVGLSEGNLEFTYGNNSKTVTLKGECVAFEGGQTAKAFWLLSADQSYVSEGPITVIPEFFSKMYTSSYAVPNATTTWFDGLVTTSPKTQRNVIDGNAWPAGEIDIVNDRFIQFGVTAVKGTTFNIDSIGMYAGGAGGSGMRFKVYTAKDSLFTESEMIADRNVANAGNTMYPISYNKIIEVKGEQSLYLRVYPWYNGAATGKTICLYGVTIKGVVTNDATGINNVSESKPNAFCFPNITNGLTTLKYELKQPSDVKIEVKSIDGKSVCMYDIKNQQPSYYQQIVDMSSCSNGLYFCIIKYEKSINVFKIIKQ
ncbi:MAG: GDSL-type esterase/lipase family protein [Paludibacter sp.]|nr:GDSL-type esterase/lipase family protein [Paludibacter sp.]